MCLTIALTSCFGPAGSQLVKIVQIIVRAFTSMMTGLLLMKTWLFSWLVSGGSIFDSEFLWCRYHVLQKTSLLSWVISDVLLLRAGVIWLFECIRLDGDFANFAPVDALWLNHRHRRSSRLQIYAAWDSPACSARRIATVNVCILLAERIWLET